MELQRHDPLSRLGLSKENYQALAQQGYVAAECCWRNGRRLGPYYKLRFRQEGRQRVRYLGRDVVQAERIAEALEALQRPRRLARELSHLMKEARSRLRRLKENLAPHLDGMYYHGYTARHRVTAAATLSIEASIVPMKVDSVIFTNTFAEEGTTNERETGSQRCEVANLGHRRDEPGGSLANPRTEARSHPRLPEQSSERGRSACCQSGNDEWRCALRTADPRSHGKGIVRGDADGGKLWPSYATWRHVAPLRSSSRSRCRGHWPGEETWQGTAINVLTRSRKHSQSSSSGFRITWQRCALVERRFDAGERLRKTRHLIPNERTQNDGTETARSPPAHQYLSLSGPDGGYPGSRRRDYCPLDTRGDWPCSLAESCASHSFWGMPTSSFFLAT
jgi:hypothetical protein